MRKCDLPDWAKVGGEVIVFRSVSFGSDRHERAERLTITAVSSAGILSVGRGMRFKVQHVGRGFEYPAPRGRARWLVPANRHTIKAHAAALAAHATAEAEQKARAERQVAAERARADRLNKREIALRNVLQRKDLKPLEREAVKRALQIIDGLELGDL